MPDAATSAAPTRRQHPLRVLFLTKYGRRAASTRHRFLQFEPYYRAAGLDCTFSALFDDAYLDEKLDRGRTAWAEVLRGVGRRLAMLLRARRFDVAVVHMEALPYLPAFFERALSSLGVPYVYEFDDASFHQYDRSGSRIVRRALGRKIGHVIGRAALVVAGNEYLAGYARRFNPKVAVVPTVVDMGQFVPRDRARPAGPVVVGWIGSPSTASYVAEWRDVWRGLTSRGDVELRLVGSGPLPLEGVRLGAVPWNEDREVADIQGFDIGIMPLRDDPWSRGKCGFKLIQYMACGLPVVASPVGVNAMIVRHGETGFLCTTDEEWRDRLRELAASASLRETMGRAGRRWAEREWSLQRWGPEVARMLAGEAGAGRAAALTGEMTDVRPDRSA